MFAEEKPFLQPLPLEPFRYYQYGERTVHLDGCVEVEAAYYGAPPGWIGRKVLVQWDGLFARLLDPRTGQLLREHLRQKRGAHRIRDEDRPRRTHFKSDSCWPGLTRPEPASALSAMPFTNERPSLERATFRACSRSPRSMAARPRTRSVPWPWNCACTNTAS